MTGIYKITSPSNKIYIGQAVDIDKRFLSYRKKKCKYQPRLHNSFIKYEVDNHIFEIIEECDISELNARERYWQDFYEVIGKNGLNCLLTSTDEKIKVISEEMKEKIRLKTKEYRHTEEAKERIRNSLIGRKVSKETRRKISESQLNKIVSKETCLKISNALKGRKLSNECLLKRSISIRGENNCRAKLILDSYTGIYYGCIQDAAFAKGLNRATLNNYLVGHRKNKTSMIYA
jgi:group I intron endonuclease